MNINHKKIISGVVGILILSIGIIYTNCGEKMLIEDASESSTTSIKLIEGRLPTGEYTVKFKDGTKVKFKQ